ncbi:MAG: hypothetical protein WC114_07180 [Smithellaceae bacterium]|jgi:hypothetical protein
MSDDTYLVQPDERLCARCNRLVSIEDFTGDSLNCNSCNQLLTQEDANKRYEDMRQLMCTRAVRGMVAERTGKKIDAPHISEYVATLVKKLGGLEAMADLHVEQLKAAIEDTPGSARVLDHFKAIVNMINASTEHRQSAPDVEGLTEDEIIAEFKVLSMEAMTEDRDQFRDILRLVYEHSPELLEDARADS